MRNTLSPIFSTASGGAAGYYIAKGIHSTQYKMITEGPHMDAFEQAVNIGMGMGSMLGLLAIGLTGSIVSASMMDKNAPYGVKCSVAALGFMVGMIGGMHHHSQNAPSNGVVCTGTKPIVCYQVSEPEARPSNLKQERTIPQLR